MGDSVKLLRADNLVKSYGDKVLLDDVSFIIREKDRIGLIGINGTGKSTLMNILSGKDSSEKGGLDHPQDYQIGYASQQHTFEEDSTILEAVFKGHSPIMQAVKEYEAALHLLEIDGSNEAHQRQYTQAEERMNREDAWMADTNAKTILTKLGIADLNKKVSDISGGQRKRLGLAQVLIQEPDLLLLDEPTNHLDYASIKWLESYLKDYKGALVVVTHDRYFLDRVTNRIIELSKGHLKEYQGNYQSYLVQRAEQEEIDIKATHKKKQLFKQELAWMRAGVKARGTKQQARINRFDDLKKEVANGQSADNMEITTASKRLGKKVFELKEASFNMGDQVILTDYDLLIQGNERLGITGANGSGKSTLLNILAGKLSLDSGILETGETVQLGYYTQENENMDESKRMIEYLQEQAEEVKQSDGTTISVTEMLERFLFPRNTHGALISKLSGGEKRRLYLLNILIKQPNVLLLDEPTNDLDVETLTILEDYLRHFKGAIITVSHDRYFLDKTVNKLQIFQGEGEIVTYYGTMSDYLDTVEGEASTKDIKAIKVTKEVAVETKDLVKEKKKLTYMEKKEWETIEDDIEKMEETIETIQSTMLKEASNAGKLQELQRELTQAEEALEDKMARWEYLSEFQTED